MSMMKLILACSCIATGILCLQKKDPVQEDKFSFDEKKVAPLPSCRWNYHYDVKKAVVAGLCFLFGSFILTMGYRRRRISFCLIGLTSISIFTYMVIITEANFSTVINILISVAAGLVACFFTTLLLYCGYFITGLFAGFMIGFIFLVIYTSFLSLNSVALPCVIVSLFGLFQTFITMWWRHRVFIVSCCIFASGVMASALDYFIEDLFIYKYLEMKIFYNKHADLCWWTYLVFGLWPLFFIIGLLIQCLLTGKEKQKETYTFIYRRHKRSSSRVHDDNNYLIRHDYHNY